MKKSLKSGPQGKLTTNNPDAVSKKKTPMVSMVEGTKTNRNPQVRGLTPPAKSKKK